MYAPTGDGTYDPENQVYGNGLIGVRLEGDQLKLKDYFIPSNWAWLRKRDLDMNVTPAIFNYKGRELMVTSSKECRIWLLDPKSLGGADHQTPLYRTPLLCNEEVDFAAAGIWGSMATWEDAQGTRWILTPIWGPPHSEFKAPISHGPVTHGAIVALKLEEKGGALVLTPAWMSRDMDLAEPPVIANGVVYTFGNGEDATQATAEGGLNSSAPRRIPLSKHAVLYALDAQTGRELYSSGTQITSFNHFSGLSVANGACLHRHVRRHALLLRLMRLLIALLAAAATLSAQTTPYAPKQSDRPEVHRRRRARLPADLRRQDARRMGRQSDVLAGRERRARRRDRSRDRHQEQHVHHLARRHARRLRAEARLSDYRRRQQRHQLSERSSCPIR